MDRVSEGCSATKIKHLPCTYTTVGVENSIGNKIKVVDLDLVEYIIWWKKQKSKFLNWV